MNLFYVETPLSNSFLLPEEESGHAIRVLRLVKGDRIRLMDGKGHFYNAVITNVQGKHCEVNLEGERELVQPREYSIHIAIAPTKNIERLEWFLEKATEIGIEKITPIICEHSERRVIKMERLQKIIIASIKQSEQAYLPELRPAVAFNDFIQSSDQDEKFICTCTAGPEMLLGKLYKRNKPVTLMIGPEGDFSKKEIDLALASGFGECSLGSSRLRTETAGLVACHAIHVLNQ